jgi:hypothetical protein
MITRAAGDTGDLGRMPMAPLADPQILACFKAVLANWYVTDYVTAKDTALEWAGKHLPCFTLKGLAKLMHQHVQAGGAIDQVRERRHEYSDRDFHYDFRLSWTGRAIYIETVLVDDDPKDPTIHIVSIHDL